MSAPRAWLAIAALLGVTSLAHAQEIVPVGGGWSLHRRIGLVTGLETVACGRDVAYARSWFGDIARWDGTSWNAVRRRGESMYGRTLAVSPDGQVFLEAGPRIVRWDGSSWVDLALPRWQGDVGSGITAPSAREVYYVGRGRIARFDGASVETYGAGTWRELTAVAVTDRFVLVGGQGGTIERHDGRAWVREPTGVGTWIRGLTAFGSSDVWAWADGPTYATSIVLHYDGRSWTHRDAELLGSVKGLGGTATAVYVATEHGVLRWNGTAWAMELATSALGAGYHSPVGVCATAHHLIVGDASGNALVRPL